MALKLVCLLLVACTSIYADIYMQNPRGSNNRLNGRGRKRSNANRLFDSENNARGGYNEGGLYYHVGSKLSIEWTNQHSCSGPKNNCELVVQYMCSDKLRNGGNKRTIKFPKSNCENNDCDNDFEYGMHENYNHYLNCYTRSRNKGLFLADQDLKNRDTARFTRQDRNGNRYGYECQEEKDYYPYWGQSPWKDIVVMTSDTSRCDYYKQESANVKGRYHCAIDLSKLGNGNRWERYFSRNPVPITKEECETYENKIQVDNKDVTITGKWEKLPAHGIPAPDCIKAPQSRDNHNGNGIDGYPNTYNWTIPNDVHEQCALRIRYNISTGDFPWETFSDSNGRNQNNQPCKSCAINLGGQNDIDDKFEAEDRNYILTGNPNVLPLKINGVVKDKFELRLAINTAQFGRTFEDRSHIFSIRPRPSNVPANAKLYNVNVRGKRGNIVQTYPATEYDFVPMKLEMNQGDYVHIQWTGNDNNPGNNAGQGRAATDRSNMLLLNEPQFEAVINAKDPNTRGHWANSYPQFINNSRTLLGLRRSDLKLLAFGGENWRGDSDQLNDAGPYFDLGVRQANTPGVFNYLCTRNNAFTNRAQKGQFVVRPTNAGDQQGDITNRMNSSEKKELIDQLEDIEKLEKGIKNIIDN